MLWFLCRKVFICVFYCLFMKRLHLVITGDVQGVCFRFYSKKEAIRLGVVGWIVNKGDGSVEVVAEGGKKQLDDLLKFCRHGPRWAHVVDVKEEWLEGSGEFSGFVVRRG